MTHFRKAVFGGIGIAAAFSVAALVSLASAQSPPFGGDEDVAYAQKLWQIMDGARLVGDDAIRVRPFEGNEPHGSIQEVLATTATVDGHTGELIIKRNHGAEGELTIQDVYDNPTEHLGAITIMFKRQAGYDPENQDWFWAKYLPSGELDTNPKGVKLSGRVAKGMAQGCIACHTARGGEDLEVLTSQ